jgi:hypothetical protein
VRGNGPHKPLPIVRVTPDRSGTVPRIVRCLTCDNGYRVVERGLSVFTGELHWRKRREAEGLHDHFFISAYPSWLRLTWAQHCERCHAAGEGCAKATP